MSRPDLKLLDGAIDMHAHTGPALFRRPLDDMDLAKASREYGMRGFVLKDHDSPTAGRAYYVRKTYPDVEAIGAVVLNRSQGGINPHVVQAGLHYGAKVIFMPSNHSKWHSQYFKGISDYPQFGRVKKQLPGEGVTVLDAQGNLTPEILQIIDLVSEADACLATSHLSLDEIRKLLDESQRRGLKKFLITHANWALCRLDLPVQRELHERGVYIEYVASSCVSSIFYEQNPSELGQWIAEFKGERLVLSSDLGQLASPPHPEGLRELIAALLGFGVPADHIEKMTKFNPAVLLGLSP